MSNEWKENSVIREYLELAYKFALEHIDGKWDYVNPSDQQSEFDKWTLIWDGQGVKGIDEWEL